VESTEKAPSNSKVPRRLGFAVIVAVALFSANRGFAAANATPSWTQSTFWFVLTGLILVAAVWFWEYTEKRHLRVRIGASILIAVVVFFLGYGPVRNQYQKEHQTPPEQTVLRNESSQQAAVPTPNPASPANTETPVVGPKKEKAKEQPSSDPNSVPSQIGDNNTVVNTPVPSNMGSGNTFVGPTDSNGNTIFNRGGAAIGNGACADSTSIAIGAGANAGKCDTSKRPVK
jgi:hypothetical protein